MRRYGSGLIGSDRHTHLLVSSLRRVLNHLSEHEVLLSKVHLRLERGGFAYGAAPSSKVDSASSARELVEQRRERRSCQSLRSFSSSTWLYLVFAIS